MQNRRHLVVLAVTAALFGSSACKEGAAPNPLPTIRLTPASVQADSAIDAARLSDRDTATPLLLDGRRVVSFHFDHVVELRKVKVFGSGVRVAVLQPGEKMLGAQPQLAELEHDRTRQVLILVAAGVVRSEFARGEIGERAAEHLLVRVEGELHR